mmetsp:Transcript_32504/g.81459  ORF Transcript_32504/g.81459 Transcript_32504/m.81459 type:complete len:302 (-) Transcript_32504:574-1479(-)
MRSPAGAAQVKVRCKVDDSRKAGGQAACCTCVLECGVPGGHCDHAAHALEAENAHSLLGAWKADVVPLPTHARAIPVTQAEVFRPLVEVSARALAPAAVQACIQGGGAQPLQNCVSIDSQKIDECGDIKTAIRLQDALPEVLPFGRAHVEVGEVVAHRRHGVVQLLPHVVQVARVGPVVVDRHGGLQIPDLVIPPTGHKDGFPRVLLEYNAVGEREVGHALEIGLVQAWSAAIVRQAERGRGAAGIEQARGEGGREEQPQLRAGHVGAPRERRQHVVVQRRARVGRAHVHKAEVVAVLPFT